MAKQLVVTGVRTKKIVDGKLTDIDLTDKNGTRFNVIEVSTPATVFIKDSATGLMKPMKQRPQTARGITGWEKSNLPSLNGAPDYEFELNLGDDVLGGIETRKVTTLDGKRLFIPDTLPYATRKDGTPIVGPDKGYDGKTTGRYTDHSTVAVVGYDSDSEEAYSVAVARAFRRKGLLIVDATPAQIDEMNQVQTDTVVLENDVAALAAKAK